MTKHSTQTIIIGAGMAGIMAARTLLEAGRDVIILEARDRVGGRTRTNHDLGASVDLGGAWIHGPIGNPLTPLQEKYGVEGALQNIDGRSKKLALAYDGDGTPLDMGDFRHGQLLAQASVATQFGSQLTEPVPDSVRSVNDLADYCAERAPAANRTHLLAAIYNNRINPSMWDAADPELVDWRLSDNYVNLPGGDMYLYGGGYNKITDALAEGLPIQLNTPVESVKILEDGVLVVANGEEFSAESVILTTPLGVLKSKQIEFDPPLPSEKVDAIGRIGFGIAEKVVLKFDDFYWPKETESFIYLTGEKEQYFSNWNNVGVYKNVPILASYQTGSHAIEFNQWSDGELLERAMDVLTKMFGEMPMPTGMVRTNWHTDPYSQGSYSYEAVGQQEDDRATLAAPIANKLFFAGEATHATFTGTVHGAYETGIRAAREVIAVHE